MYARIINPSVIHSRLKYIDGISEGDTNLFADTCLLYTSFIRGGSDTTARNNRDADADEKNKKGTNRLVPFLS